MTSVKRHGLMGHQPEGKTMTETKAARDYRIAKQADESSAGFRKHAANMTTKHKPATPLPWASHSANKSSNFGNYESHIRTATGLPLIAKARGGEADTAEAAKQNAAYIAHAANAYPRLVESEKDALYMLTGLKCPFGHPFAPSDSTTCICNYHEWYHKRRALLRELGE